MSHTFWSSKFHCKMEFFRRKAALKGESLIYFGVCVQFLARMCMNQIVLNSFNYYYSNSLAFIF